MPQLLFVYNAKSDIFSRFTDLAHKYFSPKTYPCNLCSLTYGNITGKKQWINFVKTLEPAPTFLHKDEFQKKYPGQVNTPLPAVFSLKHSQPLLLISATDINKLNNLDDLITLVKTKVT